MSENNFFNICKVVTIIESNSLSIVDNWVSVQSVKSTLENRNISILKFKNNYALAILKYFIEIIKGNKKQGECPVMTKLVNYLLVKNISPKEVFDICMGLRKSFMLFILDIEKNSEKIVIYLDELSTIFDANLSGVLNIFTELYSNAQKKLQIAKDEKNKLHHIYKIINSIDTKLIIVQNSRIILANKSFLKLLGINNLKALYEKYKKGFCFFSDINIYEDYFKTDILQWMEELSTTIKVFKTTIYNRIENKPAYFSGYISKIETPVIQYIITLNDITKEVENEQILKDNITHDELTGFRNYPTFEHLLTKKIKQAKKLKQRFFLAVADIVSLREINDKDGRKYGDAIIAEVAEDLRYLTENNIYFARLEGSRFGILLEYKTEQLCYDWCVQLLHKLNQRDEKKTVAVTEIDLSESINKLLFRVYDLIEESNNSEDILVKNDFINVLEYKELPNQIEFIQRLIKLTYIKTTIFYRELAISYKSKILKNTTENIIISFSNKQLQICSINMPVYFKLPNIGYIKANIFDLDRENNLITINQFRLDKNTPLNRQRYRITASNEIKAYISFKNRDFNVKILDMNSEYISIMIDRKRNFEISDLIYIDMLLPISDLFESCHTNATIITITKIKDAYKMVLLCHLDLENSEVLTKYISIQQIKIIHEFKN